jgi:hypothetical protein
MAVLLLFVALAALHCAPAANAASLTFYTASDTHLGHDVGNITSLSLNTVTIDNINGLAACGGVGVNCSWPASLGGGPVAAPRAVIVSGDLIDNGNDASGDMVKQWLNWTALYGFDGTDGRLHYPVYESKGNHDGSNSTDNTQPHFVATEIIARNQLRKADPSFELDRISETGLHYSWNWNASATCRVHFLQLGLYAGHTCVGCAPAPSCFYGPPCYSGFVYPENSLGFVEEDLAALPPGTPIFTVQHYGFDGYSNDWYSQAERDEYYATLRKYNVVALFVGHTHAASVYGWNGSATFPLGSAPGLPVFNTPSTQKEAGPCNPTPCSPAPSEYLVVEMTVADGAQTGALRMVQRVGEGWGETRAQLNFSCAS